MSTDIIAQTTNLTPPNYITPTQTLYNQSEMSHHHSHGQSCNSESHDHDHDHSHGDEHTHDGE